MENVVDEDAKQKIKDVVKNTVDTVKEEINREPEITQPEPTPTPAPELAPSTDTTPLIEQQTTVTPDDEPTQEERPENTSPDETNNTNQITTEIPDENVVVDNEPNIENEIENGI